MLSLKQHFDSVHEAKRTLHSAQEQHRKKEISDYWLNIAVMEYHAAMLELKYHLVEHDMYDCLTVNMLAVSETVEN